MNGWQTSEAHVTVGIVAVLTHSLNDPNLWPIAHAACAIGLALIGTSYVKHRTALKLSDAPCPSIFTAAFAWLRGRRASRNKPPTGPTP